MTLFLSQMGSKIQNNKNYCGPRILQSSRSGWDQTECQSFWKNFVFSVSTCNKIFLVCLHVYFSSFSSSCSIDKTRSHFSPANGVFMFSLGTAPLGVAAYKNNLAQYFLQLKNCLFPTCHFTADRSTCFPVQTGPAWGYSTQLTPRVASSIFSALYHKYRHACYWKRSPIPCAATYTQVDIFNAGRHKNCFIATYVDDKLSILQ